MPAYTANLPGVAPVTLQSARVRALTEIFTLAGEAAGARNIGKPLPRGARVLEVALNTSVSLGSATVAIGTATAAGKYRAAATLTTADQWVVSALNAAIGVELAAPEQLVMTTASASLPGSGKLLIRVLYVID